MVSVPTGPRRSDGNQYPSTSAATFSPRYDWALTASPDQAWCTVAAPSATSWYPPVLTLTFTVLDELHQVGAGGLDDGGVLGVEVGLPGPQHRQGQSLAGVVEHVGLALVRRVPDQVPAVGRHATSTRSARYRMPVVNAVYGTVYREPLS